MMPDDRRQPICRCLPLAALLLLTSCGGAPSLETPKMGAGLIRPEPNLFLRSAIDRDPSAYLGSFVRDGTPAGKIDEAATFRTPCSALYEVERIDAGGVTRDDYVSAGGEAAASAGAGALAMEISTAGTSVVRVRYAQTEKWRARIPDDKLGAYQACCDEGPGQCAGRVVSEFVGGTGAVFSAASRDVASSGSVTGAGFDIRDGVAWQKSLEFERAFFAFKLGEGRPSGEAVAGECGGDWISATPRSPHGMYFAGASAWSGSSAEAEREAELDATRRVIRYYSQEVSESTTRSERRGGSLAEPAGQIREESHVTARARAVARFVKQRCKRIEPKTFPSATRYQAHVLMFVGKEEVERVKAALEGGR